jgi:hypothetical protein
MYSTKLIRIIIEKICIARMACTLEKSSITIIESFLPEWLNIGTQWLEFNMKNNIHTKLNIILDILRSFAFTLESYPNESEKSFLKIMEICWNFFHILRNQYLNTDSSSSLSGIYLNYVYLCRYVKKLIFEY